MWIMISGPYSTGAPSSSERAGNLRVMNVAALEVFKRGHVPIIGVNMALPMIWAGGDEAYEQVMVPLALAMAERCDACLRVGGASKGADEEVAYFKTHGKAVYFDVADIPSLDSGK